MPAKSLCSVEGCDKLVHSRRFCQEHYNRWYRHGDPLISKKRQRRVCSIEGCGKRNAGHGWCGTHLKRWRLYGDPLVVKRIVSPPYRGTPCKYCDRPAKKGGLCAAHYRRRLVHGDPLISKRLGNGSYHAWIKANVEHKGNDCLIWPFSRDHNGYGHAETKGERHTANYFMCKYAHGDPPSPKHESAHTCGNGNLGCVNPNHLYWATHQENVADTVAQGKLMRGSRHYLTKLTEDDVRKIRSLGGTMLQREIAVLLDIDTEVVGSILRRKTWKWLT